MATKKIDTRLVTAGRSKRYTQGSVNSVIQRASSLVFDSVADKQRATAGRASGELFYGRRGTLTHFSFQDAMTELEGGAGCVLYPCGAAAVANAILAFVTSGDHILVSGAVYEPTQDFCTKILAKLNVTTTWFDHCIGSEIGKLVQPNTRVVFLESPASITMEVQDIPAIVAAVRAKAPDAVIMIDNTWAAGVLFNALEHGIDISIQAGTKYIIGHSDAMIGTAVANERCWAQLRENSYLMGQMVDADTAYMASRGLRTLATRLRQHEESGLRVAEWLAAQRPGHLAELRLAIHQRQQRAANRSGQYVIDDFTYQLRAEHAGVTRFIHHIQQPFRSTQHLLAKKRGVNTGGLRLRLKMLVIANA